jgi:hypothetical protein
MKKTMIALSALALLGTTSAAFAIEDPENRLGDRYPFLEQSAAAKVVAVRANAGRLVSVEDPENQIGDRYPHLTMSAKLVAAQIGTKAYARLIANQTLVSVDDPENRLGDRYPFLERTTPQRSIMAFASSRPNRQAHKASKKRKV